MKIFLFGISIMLLGMSESISIILPWPYYSWVTIVGFVVCGYGLWKKGE